KNNIPVAVDQTFATFYFQKPIELGVDISIYSTTKFIGGHSDAIFSSRIFNVGFESLV
ncbi:unnamed protein product, partial [marine sediment metagenome]